jgi:hypothetical protein
MKYTKLTIFRITKFPEMDPTKKKENISKRFLIKKNFLNKYTYFMKQIF